MEKNIKHTRWDTFQRNLNFKDKNQVAIDLTGSEIKFSIKNKFTDTSYIINHTATIINNIGWIAEIKIAWSIMDIDTWTYYYDIEWTDSSWFIRTILKGNIIIDYHVTT